MRSKVVLRRLVAFIAGVMIATAIVVNSATASDPITDLLAKYQLSYLPSVAWLTNPDDEIVLKDPVQVVDRDKMKSWKKDDVGGMTTFEQDRCEPANTPSGTGALHLTVPPPGEDAAQLRSTRYHRTYLRDLLVLDYFACAQTNNGQQWPYVILNIDHDGDNALDDLIFFEPAYQNPAEGGACGAVNNQNTEAYDVWQPWDALRAVTPGDETTFRACWWSAFDSTFQPGFTIRPLSQYIAEYPNAAIINSDGNHGGVRIVQGFDGPAPLGISGWVDAFRVATDINDNNSQAEAVITYDFECNGVENVTPCPAN
jgi:hypothetical protein